MQPIILLFSNISKKKYSRIIFLRTDQDKPTRYIGIYEFVRPILIIKDPHLIKKICIEDFNHFEDHVQTLPDNSDRMWNKGLFNLSGTEWKRMRHILTPSYTSSKMRIMFNSMQNFATKLVDDLRSRNEDIIEFDSSRIFSIYVNNVIASTTFGIDYDPVNEENNEFYFKAAESSDTSGLWLNIKFTLLRAFPSIGIILKGRVFNETMLQFFKAVVGEIISFREKNKIGRHDLMETLIQARKRKTSSENQNNIGEENVKETKKYNSEYEFNGYEPSMDDITAQALFFYIAAFGTSTSICSFICYELVVNPEVQKKLIAEIDEIKSRKHEIAYEDLRTLTYLDMVVSESLRKWPVAFRTDRKCIKSYTIPPEKPNEKPLHLKAGQHCWILLHPIHHNPKYWPNPDTFDPERFSAANKHNITPGSYIPFGTGPRSCIGSRFALQQIKVIIYELLKQFEIVSTSKTIIPCEFAKSSTTIIPGKGFHFGLQRRNSTF
ncbi:hypothetical protein HHI36_015307 [Cryptolaemus montrouzieri]|uniref:Cytochrome P450 n=1 Tax=Cryptolaemus montrouzieri TaxID=559131 RepID=A0ABD2N6N6_9CUCU